MVSLNYPNYPHNFLDEECHSEITELDFSQCKIGDSGEIALSFGWHYDFPRYDGAMMIDGMRNFLGYYIGEDGVYLSFNGAETAKNQYESNKNDAAEIGHLPNNKYCSAKTLYLTWVDNGGAAHLHGTVIQKQFEITSFLDYRGGVSPPAKTMATREL